MYSWIMLNALSRSKFQEITKPFSELRSIPFDEGVDDTIVEGDSLTSNFQPKYKWLRSVANGYERL